MAKRKFHEEAKYAPRRARLLEVGQRMYSSNIPAPTGIVRLQKGSDHWESLNDPAPPEEQEETAPLQQEDSLSISSPDDTDSFAPSHLEVPTLEEVSDMEEEGDDKNDDCPQPPQNQSSDFVPGDHLWMGVELMDLCNQCQVPLHMYDKILAPIQKLLETPYRGFLVEVDTHSRESFERTEVKVSFCATRGMQTVMPRGYCHEVPISGYVA